MALAANETTTVKGVSRTPSKRKFDSISKNIVSDFSRKLARVEDDDERCVNLIASIIGKIKTLQSDITTTIK